MCPFFEHTHGWGRRGTFAMHLCNVFVCSNFHASGSRTQSTDVLVRAQAEASLVSPHPARNVHQAVCTSLCVRKSRRTSKAVWTLEDIFRRLLANFPPLNFLEESFLLYSRCSNYWFTLLVHIVGLHCRFTLLVHIARSTPPFELRQSLYFLDLLQRSSSRKSKPTV